MIYRTWIRELEEWEGTWSVPPLCTEGRPIGSTKSGLMKVQKIWGKGNIMTELARRLVQGEWAVPASAGRGRWSMTRRGATPRQCCGAMGANTSPWCATMHRPIAAQGRPIQDSWPIATTIHSYCAGHRTRLIGRRQIEDDSAWQQ